MEPVYILGGGRTDFKRNLKKEGKTIRHLIVEAGKKALEDAKIDAGEIQAGAVGNFNAGQFTKQLQLGAFIPEIEIGYVEKCFLKGRTKAPTLTWISESFFQAERLSTFARQVTPFATYPAISWNTSVHR